MTKPVVTLNQLNKTINNHHIIKDLSLDLFPGEVFGFLGPNGAGKTTTIRMMVGLMKPSSGSVVIDGISLQNNYESAIRHVGAIVENPELYDYLTGYQNLIHFARMHENITKDRIMEVVKLVGLSTRIKEKVKTYSLGMRQRLGLAQALLHQPKFLILDEPTNGLDPAGIREFREFLRKIAAEEGVSIFVSSHLLSEIEMMCDRIGIIKQGELIDIRNVREETNKMEWEFEVNSVDQALSILSTQPFVQNVRNESNRLLVEAEKQAVPKMNALLVENQIQVFGIKETRKSLEDQFLELTGGESVG